VDTEPENLRVFEALQQADLDKVESPLGKSTALPSGSKMEVKPNITSTPTGPSTTTSTACRFT
jgi:hypothetical protein